MQRSSIIDLDGLGRARVTLQRVATHVLSRARSEEDGHIGLRVTASGIATPVLGSSGKVVRLTAATMILEEDVDGESKCRTRSLQSSSLRELADFAGVDLTAPLTVGSDAVALGDADAQLDLQHSAAEPVMSWFRIGAAAIDRVLADEASIVQLWPEHFDVAAVITTTRGRVNVGISPGDAAYAAPYAYISPWEIASIESDPFWNAPFGGAAPWDAMLDATDPVEATATYFSTGLDLLGR